MFAPTQEMIDRKTNRKERRKGLLASRTAWVGLISVGAAVLTYFAYIPVFGKTTQMIFLAISGALTMLFRQMATTKVMSPKELNDFAGK